MFDITVTQRCQMLLAHYISEGDTVIDCTAGNGNDTLFLARAVGRSGSVLAFDVQEKALDAAEKLLCENGLSCKRIFNCRDTEPAKTMALPQNGTIYLIHDSHEKIREYISTPPQAIVYNLGYLPGGDHSIVTNSTSTVASVRASLELIRHGGVISVVTYPGHEEGAAEDRTLSELFASLDPRYFEVLFTGQHNRNNSPNMYLCYKKP